jgi:hypothetical protein
MDYNNEKVKTTVLNIALDVQTPYRSSVASAGRYQ